MCSYINTILVPYWTKEKLAFNAPTNQECLLQLDHWTVHCSFIFHTWLDKTWPLIKYRYVSAGTTAVTQLCDVGIQQPLKLSIKESQLADVVEATLTQLK
ncbi:hypothetical protein PAXRUDRAFT_54019, partial [Paxillus rubicundulus Ve08.2h10]